MTDSWNVEGDSSSLALNFVIALNILRVHDPANEAAHRAVRRLLESIHAAFLQDGECEITISGEHVFVNQQRVRHVQEVTDLRELSTALSIGGFAFSSPPDPAALAQFLFHLARNQKWEAREDCYVEALPAGLDTHGGGKDRGPVRFYQRAIGEIRDIYHEVRERGELSMRRGRQIVGDVVEALIADESVLFGMMTIRDYDVYTFQHSVNVCITASALGIRLGLDRLTTRELGVAALFHDVGKVKIPRKILNKPGRFTPQEWEIMKSHPVLGARTLLRNRGLEPGTIRAVQVALEHHIRFDGSGYPQLYVPQMPSLYSRIVTICDCYDAMTSVRAYRQIPITPAVAMAYIWHHRDQGFDPALVKAFIGMLGAYPPGTLVRLSDETLAVVVEGPRTPDVFRPVVRRWGAKETLDLSKGKLEVQRCLDPAGLNLSDAELRAHLTLPV